MYEAALEKRHGGAVLQSVRAGLLFLSEVTGGLLPAPSLSDVVVRDRVRSAEVARVPAGDPTGAGDLLHLLRQDLNTMDRAAFDRQWGIAERGLSR